MKQIALLMALLVTALPALAHEEQKFLFYELERRIERQEQRIDHLERLERRIDGIERLEQRIDGIERKPRQAATKPLPAEHQELIDCQAEASTSIEMTACAKYMTE